MGTSPFVSLFGQKIQRIFIERATWLKTNNISRETDRQRQTRDRETKVDQRQRDKDRLETERETIRLLKNLSVRSFDEDYVLRN